MKKFFIVFCFILQITALSNSVYAQQAVGTDAGSSLQIPFVDLSISEPQSNEEVALSIQLILLLAVITLSPSIVIITTSFLRISIIFDFIRRSLSLQQVPPNTVLNGIALFLTLFIMWPTFTTIYEQAFKPFSDGEIGIETLYEETEKPLRQFMFSQIDGHYENITLFMNMAKLEKPNTAADVPTYILIPAFILNELTIAFKIGIFLFIPFIIIDMIVASTLMSMGMIMLPPAMISLPFKLILFVLVDGWSLITKQVVLSFL